MNYEQQALLSKAWNDYAVPKNLMLPEEAKKLHEAFCAGWAARIPEEDRK